VEDAAAPVYTQLPCSPLELRWRAALAARLGVPLAALGAGAGRIPFNASDAAAFDVAPLVDLGAAPAPSNTWALPAPLPQGAIYFGCVIAENGAGLRTLASTNGVVVDGTPPSLTYVADGLDFSGGTDWQSSNILDGLAAHWVAGDDESGLLWSEVAFTLDPSPVSAALAAEGWSGDARRASSPLLPAAAWDGVQSAIAAGLSDAGAAAKSPEELGVAVALAAALPPVNLASPFGTAGIANLVVRGGLNLSSGVPYFAVVRARNKAGAYSRVLASDGCVVGRATLPRPPPGATGTMGFNTLSADAAAQPPEAQRAGGGGTIGSLSLPSAALAGAASLSAGTTGAGDEASAPLPSAANSSSSNTTAANAPPERNFVFGNYSFSIHAQSANGSRIPGFVFAVPITITLYFDASGLAARLAAIGGEHARVGARLVARAHHGKVGHARGQVEPAADHQVRNARGAKGRCEINGRQRRRERHRDAELFRGLCRRASVA